VQNNTTTGAARQTSLRKHPAARINAMLRQADLIHLDIAKAAGVHETMVSHVIRRRRRNGPAVERVWTVLERILK